MDGVTKFYSIPEQFNEFQAGEDLLRWQGSNSGLFKVNADEPV